MASFKEYVKEWLWPTIKACTTVLCASITVIVIAALARLCF